MAKTPTEIRSLARSHTESALRTLAQIMCEATAPHAARVSAANSLLDRGWGKAVQAIEANVNVNDPNKLTDQILANIATGRSEDAPSASDDTPVLN